MTIKNPQGKRFGQMDSEKTLISELLKSIYLCVQHLLKHRSLWPSVLPSHPFQDSSTEIQQKKMAFQLQNVN